MYSFFARCCCFFSAIWHRSNTVEKRIFGFMSELLLDVWISTNNIKYKEMPVVYLEHENYIKRYTHSIKGKLGLLK